MTRRFDRKILIPKILEQNTNNLLNFDFHPLPNSFLPSVSNTGWSPNPKLIRKYKKGGRRGAKSIGGGEKNLVTRHREIQEQTEAVDGRPVIGSHRVYTTAVVSKSRNKWSRRNAKKKKKKRIEARVGQTIRYRPLVGGCRRFARRGWSGEEDPRGGGGKLKSSFTWKRFDWRRSANDFRSATPRRLSTYPTPPAHPVRYTPPRPDHFFESGGGGGEGGRARLAEIRTARQIET